MRTTLTCTLWGIAAAATVCQTLNAQSTQEQFLPEIDSYWTLNSVMRVETLVARTKDGDSFNPATAGSGIDFFVKPLSNRRRTNWDEANRKLLTFGLTYRYIHNVDKAAENRLQFDVSPKYPLPKDMLLDDRSRVELRIISGDVTWRYRGLRIPVLSNGISLPKVRLQSGRAYVDCRLPGVETSLEIH